MPLKKHIGFYPGSEAVETFKEELKNYSVDKGTIRIPYGQVDTELNKKSPGGASIQETMHELQFSFFEKAILSALYIRQMGRDIIQRIEIRGGKHEWKNL